jgi:hypothetical protein
LLRCTPIFFASSSTERWYASSLASSAAQSSALEPSTVARRSAGVAGAASKAGEAAGEAAGSFPKLGELSVRFNKLDNEAAIALVGGVWANPYVHSLSLEHNVAVQGEAVEALDVLKLALDVRFHVASWLAKAGLVSDDKNGHPTSNHGAFGWIGEQGPPLASPYAAPALELRPDSRSGLLELDDAILAGTHPALARLSAKERSRLVKAMLEARDNELRYQRPGTRDEL